MTSSSHDPQHRRVRRANRALWMALVAGCVLFWFAVLLLLLLRR